jgi:predicted nucleic acid-binding protein
MIFLDTSGIVALWNRRDQWHDAATDAWQRVPPGTPLLTTSYVLAECANAFARSELRTQLVRLTDHLTAHDRLVFPTEAEWHRAKLAYAHERPGLPT